MTRGFEEKTFSYTYSLFKGKHCMESKIIEYGIILLHEYNVKQIEVIYRLLFTVVTDKFQEHQNIYISNTFPYFFYSYDITSLENIHPIIF